MLKIKPEWSKTYEAKPKDHMVSHILLDRPRFTVSYEKDNICPPISMYWLLGWEYARVWQKERDAYQAYHRRKMMPKRVSNDFTWWLKKRAPRVKGTC